jgi:hypothetical protein
MVRVEILQETITYSEVLFTYLYPADCFGGTRTT